LGACVFLDIPAMPIKGQETLFNVPGGRMSVDAIALGPALAVGPATPLIPRAPLVMQSRLS
jgi:hypothetical protein